LLPPLAAGKHNSVRTHQQVIEMMVPHQQYYVLLPLYAYM
jgi:hypothetical protein